MTVDIAIIDSGINPDHFHVNGVAGGFSLRLDDNHNIVKDDDFADFIGHGTAIAGVIRKSAPLSDLYAVKIFQNNLGASGSLLMSALEWAVGRRIKIIHLSLGTEADAHKSDLEKLCREAYSNNLIVLAAGRHPEDTVFPASFTHVIGVCRQNGCDPGKIVYYPGRNIEFGACGRPRDLPGLRREMNFRGHSFAVAHVTAQVAMLVGKKPDAPPVWIKNRLIQTAMPFNT